MSCLMPGCIRRLICTSRASYRDPAGEGYSLLWEPGGEKVMCPWGEAAVFTPPGGWYHQHFNLGDEPARYLKFGHLPQLARVGEYRNQIEYSG